MARQQALIAAISCLVILACAVVGLTTLAEPSAAKADPQACGRAGKQVLYAREGLQIVMDGKTPGTFVCNRDSRVGVKLGSGPVKGPFSITSPWAAGVEATMDGQDTALVSVLAASARSGQHVRCQVGAANRPGQLPRIKRLWVAPEGGVAVSAEVPLGEGPELAVCGPSGLDVLASGSEFDPGSIKVSGRNRLSWTVAGNRESTIF